MKKLISLLTVMTLAAAMVMVACKDDPPPTASDDDDTSSTASSTSTSSSGGGGSSSSSGGGGANDGYLEVTVLSTAAVWDNEQFAAGVSIPDATGMNVLTFDYKVTAGTDGNIGFFFQDSGENNADTVVAAPSLTYDGSVQTATCDASTLASTIDMSDIAQVWLIVGQASHSPSADLTVEIDNLKFTDGASDALIYDGGTDNLGSVWDTTDSILTSKALLGDL